MKIKSSESKGKLERPGKGLITSLGFKSKLRPQKQKRQSMPSEMSVRRAFLRLLRSLINLRNYLMRRRDPNMSLLTPTFIHQDSLKSVWWDLITSVGMIMVVIRKWMLRPWTLMLRMRTNQTHHRAQKFIGELFYGRKRIKTDHRRQNVIAEQFCERIRVYYYRTKRQRV